MLRQFVFLSFAILSLAPQARAQEEAAASALVCVDGLAGSYAGIWEDHKIRLNVICLDEQRVIGSLSDVAIDNNERGIIASNFSVGYGFAAATDDSLILSTFGFTEEERHSTSSKTRAAYMRLNLDKLKQGIAEGYFVNDHSHRFNFFSAKRDKSFRVPDPKGDRFYEQKELEGIWKFQTPMGPAQILADVIADVPTLHLIFSNMDGRAIHLLDGSVWNGTGTFSLTTPMGDGEPDQGAFFYVFGRLIGNDQMEVSYVSQTTGLQGPFLAKRESTNQFPGPSAVSSRTILKMNRKR